MKRNTRFRAYQLADEGASFSYSVNKHFTLIEARYNEINTPNIKWEMMHLGIDRVDVLHITSWDEDHCKAEELKQILIDLRPKWIEIPFYVHDTDNAKKAMEYITLYKEGTISRIGPSLVKARQKIRLFGEDVYYNPMNWIESSSNDKSVVKLFRLGSFTVLSLGDCMSEAIRDSLMADEILQNEVDVLILAHHGADNGFTTKEFLKAINPRVAICATNYMNKYGHPDKAIVDRLNACDIPYFSTKTGDVIVHYINKYNFKVINMIANNTRCEDLAYYNNKTWFVNEDEP